MTINYEVLRQAVMEYLNEENEQHLFLRTLTHGWWKNQTKQEIENYTEHEERVKGAWNTVGMMCKMLEIDSTALAAVMKSIARWEKHNSRYDRCIWGLDSQTNERIYKTVTENWEEVCERQYYKSTGRKICA